MSKTKLNDNRMNRTHIVQHNEDLKLKRQSDEISTSSRRSKSIMLPGVFDERKALVSKWFVKWNEPQRLAVLEDLVNHCKIHQLEQLNVIIGSHKPVFHDDFTHQLPRVLTLHIFSFLDPRSLSRCAQVSWYWKSLAELDDLWEPLCCRLGWTLSYTPTPFEKGTWKRMYLNSIALLKKTVTATVRSTKELERLSLADGHQARPRTGVPVTDQRPPWKGSDPTPRDTWRHNYLENDETIGKQSNPKSEVRRKVNARIKMAGAAVHRSGSLTRSKSSPYVLEDNDFSTWSQYNGGMVGGAPFISRPMTADTTLSDIIADTTRHIGPSVAFDRTFSTAVITHDGGFAAGTLSLKQSAISLGKKYDVTIY